MGQLDFTVTGPAIAIISWLGLKMRRWLIVAALIKHKSSIFSALLATFMWDILASVCVSSCPRSETMQAYVDHPQSRITCPDHYQHSWHVCHLATHPVSVMGRIRCKRSESVGVYVAPRGSLDKEVLLGTSRMSVHLNFTENWLKNNISELSKP